MRPNPLLQLTAPGMAIAWKAISWKSRNGACMTEFLRLTEGWSLARIKITPL